MFDCLSFIYYAFDRIAKIGPASGPRALWLISLVLARHVGGGGCAGGRRCRPGEFYPAVDSEEAKEQGQDELSR